MSFSVRCQRSGLEYSGTNFNTLFAQRSNLLRPSFYRMISRILRFNREARELLAAGSEEPLGDWLARKGYGRRFQEQYLLPMGAAIWSTSAEKMLAFAAFKQRFTGVTILS